MRRLVKRYRVVPWWEKLERKAARWLLCAFVLEDPRLAIPAKLAVIRAVEGRG